MAIRKFFGILITELVKTVCSKGVAIFSGGSGGGRSATVSDQWGVLSPTTKVLVGVYFVVIGILFLIGIYRLYKWCTRNPT